ncbi:hypothetical protein ZIOFF_040373 [Zingiber officinale]|uniref:RING-type domain-containing protein n=1 Tax=Zingiber officinale TaxID=94328 RepID=A0A8J5G633_ZINOF|nr:hypothetical protein ZIOFF_040373 [Zingiber officinale]
MGYDAMANSAKKKRTNRSGKLKHCSLLLIPPLMGSSAVVGGSAKGEDDCKILGEDHPSLSRKDVGGSKIRMIGEDEAPHRQRRSDSGPPPMPHQRGSMIRRRSTDSSSPSVTDADEEDDHVDDGVLDDWEAVADAISEVNDLADHDPEDHLVPAALSSVATASPIASRPTTRPEPIRSAPRAWKPDDASRPRSLPSISKQWSFPAKVDQKLCLVGQQKDTLLLPCPCPICYEDLDPTDSRFFPCSCGFRLCLFCHKRILEDDGGCPGCRRPYNSFLYGQQTINSIGTPLMPHCLSCSFSMISRSSSREH